MSVEVPGPSAASGPRPRRRLHRPKSWTIGPRRWSRRRRRLLTTAVALVALIALIAGGGAGYIAYRNGQIHRIRVSGLRTSHGGPEDILLIGSTSRCALKHQNPAFGLCSQGVNGVNSDVVMVIRLDPAHRRASLLSFPRDTFLPNARPGESNRIDSALAYGPSQLVHVIEEDFAIPINHFVELNFDTFAGVVNALGGIDMYFPDRLYDAYSRLEITHTGCIHLTGFQALAVVRARHLNYWRAGQTMNLANLSDAGYDGSGDLGRIIRDHEFLRVLAQSVARRGLGNPITDNSLLGAVAPDLTVDSRFSLGEMVKLALFFHSVDVSSVPETTLPILVDPNTYMYKGYPYGDVVFPSEPQDQEAVDQFLGHRPQALSLAPATVTVSVVDGNDDPSTAATTAARLHDLGYRVVGSSSQTPVGPVAETDVVYSPGHLDEGERVEASLSGAVALERGTTLGGADVSVVTGSDFAVASPPTSHPHHQGHVTTPTSSNTAVQSALDPPTPATSALAPYDPRACPATTR